ncbi:MAG: peptidylprolyl isomerase [Desulfovibrio sp.]|nr:peptidylprolyl isomerase [Desulfovibrio sp.]
MPGDAAEVDGQSISFAELEAARISLFTGFSPHVPDPDDAALHSQYRYVLSRMIEELVICRYMEQNGFALAPGALEEEERRIRADYPEGAFDDMIIRGGLVIGDWRKALYRRLTVEQFLSRVLRPEITITADEVQQYYLAHTEEFVVPELWHFLRVLGRDVKAVEDARAELTSGVDAAEAQKKHLVTIQDINMSIDLVPEELAAVLAPLAPGQASKVVKSGQEYTALVLLKKTPASVLDPAEISQRVEHALSEEKMRSIYAEWLQKRLKAIKVRITPALKEASYAGPAAKAP